MTSLLFIYRSPVAVALASEEWSWPDTTSAVSALKNLIAACNSKARTENYSAQQAANADLAVVALIDENVNLTARTKYPTWLTNTLGQEVLRHGLAGQKFFDELDKLLDPSIRLSESEARVLELYLLCLRLGFKGKHNHPDDHAKLERYIDSALARLEESPEIRPAPKPVAEISYPPIQRKRLRSTAAILAIVLLVLAGYVIATLHVARLTSSVHAIAGEPSR